MSTKLLELGQEHRLQLAYMADIVELIKLSLQLLRLLLLGVGLLSVVQVGSIKEDPTGVLVELLLDVGDVGVGCLLERLAILTQQVYSGCGLFLLHFEVVDDFDVFLDNLVSLLVPIQCLLNVLVLLLVISHKLLHLVLHQQLGVLCHRQELLPAHVLVLQPVQDGLVA